MKRKVRVKSYVREGYKVSGPITVSAHQREIDVKKASSGSAKKPMMDLSKKDNSRPILVEEGKDRIVYIQSIGFENVYYKDKSGQDYYAKPSYIPGTQKNRNYSKSNNGMGLPVNEKFITEAKWQKDSEMLKFLQIAQNKPKENKKLNWKLTNNSTKSDGSQIVQIERTSGDVKFYLNMFSDDKGKSYMVRVMEMTNYKDYENAKEKITFKNTYPSIRMALDKVKSITKISVSNKESKPKENKIPKFKKGDTIERISNGSKYTVEDIKYDSQRNENLVLIDRGPVVGRIYEEEGKFKKLNESKKEQKIINSGNIRKPSEHLFDIVYPKDDKYIFRFVRSGKGILIRSIESYMMSKQISKHKDYKKASFIGSIDEDAILNNDSKNPFTNDFFNKNPDVRQFLKSYIDKRPSKKDEYIRVGIIKFSKR